MRTRITKARATKPTLLDDIAGLEAECLAKVKAIDGEHQRMEDATGDADAFEREIRMLSLLRHENIVGYFGAINLLGPRTTAHRLLYHTRS